MCVGLGNLEGTRVGRCKGGIFLESSAWGSEISISRVYKHLAHLGVTSQRDASKPNDHIDYHRNASQGNDHLRGQ